MSRNSSLSRKSLEDEFSEFLVRRVTLAGGSLQIQHITGHLSQVRYEIRQAIGTSMSDISNFLKKYTHLFSVDKHVVSLANNLEYDSDSSDRSYSNLPPEIKNGKGVIVKLFPEFGFIKSKDPIKTEIYFKSNRFGNGDENLTNYLYIGAIVFFHAKKYKPDPKHDKSKCKYSATKVWRTDSDFERSTNIQKSRKTRDTGLYDPLHLDSEGIIQNVFPNLGFISVKGNNNNTVFFHKNRVQNYDNIVDLTKVFSKGDKVEFSAHRSSKADAKARWEATKVWKMGKELTISESDRNQNINPTSDMGDDSLIPPPISQIKSKEMIRDQRGKICPRPPGAVIKFNEHGIADGDSAAYYVCGTQVTEIGWEFAEGDDVYFDAVKIKSAPGWKAVLVWTGKKPDIVLPTCLGDFSEFITDEEDNGEICSSIYTSKCSSYMSESCSSSVKTESVSSKVDDSKENIQKISGFIADTETKDSVKKLYKNHNTSSEDSLASASSKKIHHLKRSIGLTDTSSKSTKRSSKLAFSNRRDGLYPADSTYKNIEVTENLNTCTTMKTANHMITDNETENSSGYGSILGDKTIQKKKGKNFACNNPELKKNIKRFCNVTGKISTLYSKFAEVKSSNSENPISFHLRDFYLNGMSVEELEVEHLKEILNIGDSILYNYFMIVDDSGHIWQKVTMAWLGSKPKSHDEMSAEDFISQHNLSVTLSNKHDLAIKSANHIIKVTENDTESSSEYVSADEKEKTAERMKDKNSEFRESIKNFYNVNGKITTVYSKFAEVKSCNLENTLSFFVNDFYLDGESAEDLEVDDLKQILKVGDSICYNFFVVIDDFGQSFQKVTVAWKGSEPKERREMSADDFIQKHGISVSQMNQLNSEDIPENKNDHKEFLTSFVDEVPDSHMEKTSRTESCSDEESLNYESESQELDRTEFPIDFKSLSSAVSRILKRNGFSLDSVVDLNSISGEIINLILKSSFATSVSSADDKCLNCMQENTSLNNKTVNTKNTEVQTIVTGDIIAQNICTDC